jgi:HPt (histidine-containing phosphotransfer) domain-containing protein
MADTSDFDEFVRSMREPVHGIVGMTEILQQTALSDTQKECVRVIDDSARKLKKLLRAVDLQNWQERPQQHLRILNYQGLLNRVGDKIEIAEEVIRNIRESLPTHVKQCRTAWEQRNIHDLRQIAHTIKGSAGTAGAERVADRAGRINKLIRNGTEDPDVLDSFLEELEEEAASFLKHLEQDDGLRKAGRPEKPM